jgi:hypothetical protein
VPALAKGLYVMVKPCNLRRSLLFKEIVILAVPRGPCLRNPLLMAVKAPLIFPAVPGRRFDATAPGPRRVIIKSGPTGGRRCPRYGTLLKRWPRVRSSWSRSGSFNGTTRPGVARELPFKKPFQRRGGGHRHTHNIRTQHDNRSRCGTHLLRYNSVPGKSRTQQHRVGGCGIQK